MGGAIRDLWLYTSGRTTVYHEMTGSGDTRLPKRPVRRRRFLCPPRGAIASLLCTHSGQREHHAQGAILGWIQHTVLHTCGNQLTAFGMGHGV